MKKTIWTLFFAAAIMALTSCSRRSDNDSVDVAENQNEAKFEDAMEDDTEFAVNAAADGMLEVQLGELAMANASLQQVKDFGQRMVTDHGQANEELRNLAQQKNISLPSGLDEKGKEKYDELATKRGTEFDQAYSDFMVKGHKEDIDEFQKQANNGTDPELRSWAAEKVPVLQNHLSMAETMKEAVDNAADNRSDNY